VIARRGLTRVAWKRLLIRRLCRVLQIARSRSKTKSISAGLPRARCKARENLSNQQHAGSVCEILPLYRIYYQQLRHSNPEIRQSLGFFSPLFLAPSLCLASLAPNHSQKRRKMVVLGAAPRHFLPTFSKRRAHFCSCYLSQAFEDRHFHKP